MNKNCIFGCGKHYYAYKAHPTRLAYVKGTYAEFKVNIVRVVETRKSNML